MDITEKINEMVQRDIPAEKEALQKMSHSDFKMLRDGYYETIDGMAKFGKALKKISRETKLFGFDHIQFIKAKQAFDKIQLGDKL